MIINTIQTLPGFNNKIEKETKELLQRLAKEVTRTNPALAYHIENDNFSESLVLQRSEFLINRMPTAAHALAVFKIAILPILKLIENESHKNYFSLRLLDDTCMLSYNSFLNIFNIDDEKDGLIDLSKNSNNSNISTKQFNSVVLDQQGNLYINNNYNANSDALSKIQKIKKRIINFNLMNDYISVNKSLNKLSSYFEYIDADQITIYNINILNKLADYWFTDDIDTLFGILKNLNENYFLLTDYYIKTLSDLSAKLNNRSISLPDLTEQKSQLVYQLVLQLSLKKYDGRFQSILCQLLNIEYIDGENLPYFVNSGQAAKIKLKIEERIDCYTDCVFPILNDCPIIDIDQYTNQYPNTYGMPLTYTLLKQIVSTLLINYKQNFDPRYNDYLIFFNKIFLALPDEDKDKNKDQPCSSEALNIVNKYCIKQQAKFPDKFIHCLRNTTSLLINNENYTKFNKHNLTINNIKNLYNLYLGKNNNNNKNIDKFKRGFFKSFTSTLSSGMQRLSHDIKLIQSHHNNDNNNYMLDLYDLDLLKNSLLIYFKYADIKASATKYIYIELAKLVAQALQNQHINISAEFFTLCQHEQLTMKLKPHLYWPESMIRLISCNFADDYVLSDEEKSSYTIDDLDPSKKVYLYPYYYDFTWLVYLYNKTGKFIDPYTQTEFTPTQMKVLLAQSMTFSKVITDKWLINNHHILSLRLTKKTVDKLICLVNKSVFAIGESQYYDDNLQSDAYEAYQEFYKYYDTLSTSEQAVIKLHPVPRLYGELKQATLGDLLFPNYDTCMTGTGKKIIRVLFCYDQTMQLPKYIKGYDRESLSNRLRNHFISPSDTDENIHLNLQQFLYIYNKLGDMDKVLVDAYFRVMEFKPIANENNSGYTPQSGFGIN